MMRLLAFVCLSLAVVHVRAYVSSRHTTSALRRHRPSSSSSSLGAVKYGGLHHCGILVSDVEQSKAFFMEVFGWEDESHLRPKTLPYPGAFLKIGPNQIHLMQLPNPDPTTGRPEHGGRDRHTALTVNNIDVIKDRLESRGMTFTMSMSGRRALFCRDRDGNAFEFMEDVSL